jgi:GTP-binding protein
LNALLNRRSLVKTSATPGKTQLVNFFLINNRFYFVDLPGYGYARAPKGLVDTWAPMIEGYFKDVPQIAATVVLLDVRREIDARDVRMLEWLRHYNIPAVVAFTKADKLTHQDKLKARREAGDRLGLGEPPLLTSAKSGLGNAELRAVIARHLENAERRPAAGGEL